MKHQNTSKTSLKKTFAPRWVVAVLVASGIVLGVVLSGVFISHYLERRLLQKAARDIEEVRMVVTVLCEEGVDVEESCQDKAMEQEISRQVVDYGGRVNGKVRVYGVQPDVANLYVVDAETVRGYIDVDIDGGDGAALPIIPSTQWAAGWYWFDDERARVTGFGESNVRRSVGEIREMQEELLGKTIKSHDLYVEGYDGDEDTTMYEPVSKDTLYRIVGYSRDGQGDLRLPADEGVASLLNNILGSVEPHGRYAPLVVDDGSGVVQEYIGDAFVPYYHQLVVEFDNLKDAYKYYEVYSHENGVRVYGFMDNRVEIREAFKKVNSVVWVIVGLVFGLIAIAVVAIYFVKGRGKILNQCKTKAMTKIDKRLMAAAVLSEWCIGVVGLAMMTAIGVALVVIAANAEGLEFVLVNYYG